jgi:hypothetical protein
MGAFVPPLTGFLDQALTNLAKRFVNNELFADRLAPRVPIPYQSGKYWIFDRADQELLQQTLRQTGAPAQRIRRTLSTGAFFAPSHALEAQVPDEDARNYQAGDLRQDTVQTLMNKILLDLENRVATMLTDTTQVTNNQTNSGTSQWSDLANSAPITDVEAAKASVRQAGVKPNFMIVGDQVYQKLIVHPSIVERFKYAVGGAVTEKELAQVFGVENFYVGSAVQLDKAGNVSFLWGKHAVIGFVNSSAGLYDVSGAKNFVWTGAPGTIDGYGVVVARDPQPTAKSDLISADFYYSPVITAVETLYLIKNAVA